MQSTHAKVLMAEFFKRNKGQLNRCLAPGMKCLARAILAHSIPNAQALELLVRNGHVRAIVKKIKKGVGPVVSFEDVGRNRASTFTGFCGEHDRELFRPLDTQKFDPSKPDHLFLAAYRAVAREQHALMDGTFKLQSTYQKRVDMGIDPPDRPSPAGLLALEQMMNCYLTYEYKVNFDEALIAKDYAALIHDIIHLDHDAPSVAACSLFSIDNAFIGDDWLRVALNVIPHNQHESWVVMSYLIKDAHHARTAMNALLNSEGHYQKYLLSKMILNNCENFVISPRVYDQWSQTKIHSITEYFARTTLTRDLDVEDANLQLFG